MKAEDQLVPGGGRARRAFVALAAAIGALIAAGAGAQFPPIVDPNALEAKCEVATDKALSKLVGARAKCVQKCIATARKTGGPYGGCLPPVTDPATDACLSAPSKGAESKARASIVKACSADCPDCYQASDCFSGVTFVTDTSSQIDAFYGITHCREAGGTTPMPAEAKCEDTVLKALSKFWASKSKCYQKCIANERKGRIAPGSCSPPVPSDPATQACIFSSPNGVEVKTAAKIDKACEPAMNPANQKPACYGTTTGMGWVAVMEANVDFRVPITWCEEPPPPPVCCELGGFCGSATTTADCVANGGVAVEGAVCDATDACVPPPGAPGGCCQVSDLDGNGCTMLPVDECASLPGAIGWTPNAVCTASGDCAEDPVKLVFVSSSTFAADDGGLAAADALCQSETLGLPGIFKAWLSDGVASPATRFTHATVPYRRVDGVTIADDWTDLTDGTLDAPIDRDAFGFPVGSVQVFTGTASGGTALASFDCGGWTSTVVEGAAVGTTASVSSNWTADALEACSTPRRLYCFQQ